MSAWRWLARTWPRLGLAAVVLAAAGQTLLWVFLVPIYQAPDEAEHLDYALAINAHRGLFLVQNSAFRSLPGSVHPYTLYLQKRAHTVDVAFHPSVKMPAGYGTAAFYEALDRDAPPSACRIDTPSQLAALYPFGYYALLAGWIDLVRLGQEGVVAVFFGARLFSVVLLAASLLLSHGTVRLLGCRPGFSLLITACIGSFPLTSFLSSYVQPDNLAFTLVSLCFYLTLRARRRECSSGPLALLGLALGALLVTKTHFWLCVALPALAMLGTELGSLRRWLLGLLLLLLPSLALGAAYWWTVRGTPNYFAPTAERSPSLPLAFLHAVKDFHLGQTHKSFWGLFGWLDTPLTVRDADTTTAVWWLIRAFAWPLAVLALCRFGRVAYRLGRVAWKGRRWLAVRAAFSNPVVNSYFLFTALMFALYIRTDNRFGAQGRNWFPFLLPIFLVALVYAPKALPRRRGRVALSGVATVALLLFSILGNYYARVSIAQRYYLPCAAGQTEQAALPLTKQR